MNDQKMPCDTMDDDDDDDQFLGDPLIPPLSREEQDDYFALGLVVNWPIPNSGPPSSSSSSSSSTTQQQNNNCHYNYNATNYESFLSAVKAQCFLGKKDFLFCLPFHSLHVTIASLFAARHSSELPSSNKTTATDDGAGASGRSHTREQWRSTFLKEWKDVLLRASSNEDWPRRPLELQLDSAQIATRAGILLWKENTGGIAKIRRCLQIAVKSTHPHLQEHLRIPNIIHTTFVRYLCKDYLSTSTTSTKTSTNRDNDMTLRPNQSHSILIEHVVPNQALFDSNNDSNNDNPNNDNPNNDNPPIGSSSSTKDKMVIADCVNFVNCKIYLQSPRKEKDHEIYLALPLRE